MTKTYLHNDELKIHYYIKGKGQPLIFIHGLAASLNNWIYSYPYFSKKGYQVIGIDLPGYGNSDKPERFFSIPDYAEIIKEFILHLNLEKEPILIGNSMGGHISVYFAAKYKSRLRGLVIVDSSGLNEMGLFESFFVNFTFDKNNIGNILKYTIDIFSGHLFHNPNKDSTKVFNEELKKMSKRDDYTGYCHALDNSTKAMMKFPVKDLLTEIQVPVQIIWGKNDTVTPPNVAEEFHELLPDSDLYWIDKCGHAPMMEHPEEFNECLQNWLTKRNF